MEEIIKRHANEARQIDECYNEYSDKIVKHGLQQSKMVEKIEQDIDLNNPDISKYLEQKTDSEKEEIQRYAQFVLMPFVKKCNQVVIPNIEKVKNKCDVYLEFEDEEQCEKVLTFNQKKGFRYLYRSLKKNCFYDPDVFVYYFHQSMIDIKRGLGKLLRQQHQGYNIFKKLTELESQNYQDNKKMQEKMPEDELKEYLVINPQQSEQRLIRLVGKLCQKGVFTKEEMVEILQ